jgi:hypothetical protein
MKQSHEKLHQKLSLIEKQRQRVPIHRGSAKPHYIISRRYLPTLRENNKTVGMCSEEMPYGKWKKKSTKRSHFRKAANWGCSEGSEAEDAAM